MPAVSKSLKPCSEPKSTICTRTLLRSAFTGKIQVDTVNNPGIIAQPVLLFQVKLDRNQLLENICFPGPL
jgi:hypothetical protein